MRKLPIPVCQSAVPSRNPYEWIPLTPIEQMAMTEYDVLIVGTGAGGGAALWRLAQQWGKSGKRIGVVEAGYPFVPTHLMNVPTYTFERLLEIWDSTMVGLFRPDHAAAQDLAIESLPWSFKRFRALGGRTLLWAATSPRMDPIDVAEWPLTYQELEAYYHIAENVMNVTNQYTKGAQMTQVMLERLRRNGFPDADDMPLAADLQQTQLGQVHSNVFFSSFLFLAMAYNTAPFDLTVGTRAVQVLVEKGKAEGVVVITPDKSPHVLRAKQVVISAGTMESPRILLCSRIDNPAIGHYLINHSRIIGNIKVNRSEFPENLGNLNIIIPRTKDRRYELLFNGPGPYHWYHYRNEPLQNELPIGGVGLGMVEPQYHNYVALDWNKKDEYGVPEIKVQFTYSQRDIGVIHQMLEGLVRAAEAMGVSFFSPDGNPPICLSLPGQDGHEMGTCRMGLDPATSVTNSFGQVHGISGLYVADNSILPTGGAANPTLTTVALAIRTADYIVSRAE